MDPAQQPAGHSRPSLAALPADILGRIVDRLDLPDIPQFARTCLYFQDIADDDARWARRLLAIGCWNETAAKEHQAQAWRAKAAAQRERRAGKRSSALLPPPEPPGDDAFLRRSSPPAADAAEASTIEELAAPARPLCVLDSARSVRGKAKDEFARVYSTLAPYYIDIYSSPTLVSRLLTRAFPEPTDQARMYRQLQRFSLADWSPQSALRRTKLRSLIGIFENSALQQFELAIDQEDYDNLARKHAQVLVILDSSTVAIDLFLQKRLISVVDQIDVRPPDCFDLRGRRFLPEPTATFFRQLADGLNEQAGLIRRVFPAGTPVFFPLVERAAEDELSDFIASLFEQTKQADSADAFVLLFACCLGLCANLVDVLEPPEWERDRFKANAMQIFIDYFSPHADRYMDGELSSFKTTISRMLLGWQQLAHDHPARPADDLDVTGKLASSNQRAAKSNFMSTFKKMIMLPVTVVAAIPFPAVTARPAEEDKQAEGAAATANSSTSMTSLAMQKSPEDGSYTGMSSLVSLDLAVQMSHQAKSYIDRLFQLASLGSPYEARAKSQCESIFISLISTLADKHICLAFDKSIGLLKANLGQHPQQQPQHQQQGETGSTVQEMELLKMFIGLVNVGDLAIQMVDVFFQQRLVDGGIVQRGNVLAASSKEKRKFEQSIDERVAAGLNIGIEVLMKEVEVLCATLSGPLDYDPAGAASLFASQTSGGSGGADLAASFDTFTDSRPAAEAVEIGPTRAAERVVEFLREHLQMLRGSTEQSMLDLFNKEIGMRLFGTICKHIKRQRVSEAGAVPLICDLNHYRAFVSTTLRAPDLLEYYSALQQVAQIYLIPGRRRVRLDLPANTKYVPGAARDRNSVAALSGGAGEWAAEGEKAQARARPASVMPVGDWADEARKREEKKKKKGRGRASMSISSIWFGSGSASVAADGGDRGWEGGKEIAGLISDHGRYGGVFTLQEVYDFAARRADWLDIQPEVERALNGTGCVVM